VNVQPGYGPRTVAAPQVSLEKANRIRKVIAGALIVGAGRVIFSPNFVGTFPELLGALLWGFSVDVGAAKLGELTEPVKGLKPTIPVPKANA
jgi:hypothetical protein